MREINIRFIINIVFKKYIFIYLFQNCGNVGSKSNAREFFYDSGK